MELNQKERAIIKKFITELGKVWHLENYQVVRKIGRWLNTQENVYIIRLLYKIIQEEGSR